MECSKGGLCARMMVTTMMIARDGRYSDTTTVCSQLGNRVQWSVGILVYFENYSVSLFQTELLYLDTSIIMA